MAPIKKTRKQPSHKDSLDEEDDYEKMMSKVVNQYQKSIKKVKMLPNTEVTDILKKIQDFYIKQEQARKQYIDNIFENLSTIRLECESDYNTMNKNEKILNQFSSSIKKHVGQATEASEQRVEEMNEIQLFYKKQVEGLLARGAMKPDDRPIWLDVYRAFPPLVEPLFARPKPDIKPIRQIFYKEDVIRAEFHSKGVGLGTVNMLAQSNDTQIKRLVEEYEKLKAEGIPEEELVEKSATAVGVERKEQYEAAAAIKSAKTTENPNSVTSEVLAEADLKNIFKE